jgi:HTH-like domain
VDTTVEAQIRTIIEAEPAAGVRMITARVRRASAVPVNHKNLHRIVQLNNWQVRQRPQGHRPRVQGWRRGRRDLTSGGPSTRPTFCGRDGGAI